MLTDNEYMMAWGLYLVAVVGLGAVWWRITRPISVRWLQNCFRVVYFSLLVTPCLVVADTPRMAPAFMIWILESTIVESENVARVYVPLTLTVVIGLVLAFGEALFQRRKKPIAD